MLTDIQYKIIKTSNIESLSILLNDIEPRQLNGFKTPFNSHILHALWYNFTDFYDCKRWCIDICKYYNK